MITKWGFFNFFAQSLNQDIPQQNQELSNNSTLEDFTLNFFTEIFEQIIYKLNLLSLVFSIFLVYIFLAEFFQHRIINPRKGKGPIEKKGVKSINRAIQTSFRQILASFLYFFYTVFSLGFLDIVIHIIVIILFLIKFRFDFVEILDDLKYFKWLENYRKSLLWILGKR